MPELAITKTVKKAQRQFVTDGGAEELLSGDQELLHMEQVLGESLFQSGDWNRLLKRRTQV
jgi:hypothetical protein